MYEMVDKYPRMRTFVVNKKDVVSNSEWVETYNRRMNRITVPEKGSIRVPVAIICDVKDTEECVLDMFCTNVNMIKAGSARRTAYVRLW